jgi:NAD(P)-dependent dehydrogenase (short-subunit alcohol dehydrogenase family)
MIDRLTSSAADRKSHLNGRIALITGASRGIGFALARALAEEGCQLAVTARNGEALEKAARQLPAARVVARACDVTKISEVDSLFASVEAEFGRIDILINNAGISHAITPIDRLEPAVWEKVMATNLTGMFLVTRRSLPLMKPGATIVNNISVRGVFAGEAAYCASKHGALALTNTLREELRPKKIRVIALMPGATDTEIWSQFWPDAPRANMMTPDTVAAAVVGALLLPVNSSVDELVINPVTGKL